MSGDDVPARLGGDEFVVLLTALTANFDSSLKMAVDKADALRLTLAQDYVLLSEQLQQIHLQSALSIGVAILEPGRQETKALLREADQAMYRVKSASKSGLLKSNSATGNVDIQSQAI